MNPGDRKPGEPPAPRRKDVHGMTDEERAALGEPPGRAQLQARQAKLRDEDELARIEAEIAEVENYRMPLMEHLIELKNRLLWSLLSLLVTTSISFYFAKELYDFLTAPFIAALSEVPGVEGSLSLVHSPFEGVFVWLKISVVGGLLLGSPVLSWHMWQFVAPGLYRTERRIVLPLTVTSVALFLAGAAFCFYGIFPFAFPFFIEVLGVEVNLSADGYLSAVIRMMLAFGLCFQLPVGSFFLARIGLVDAQDLWEGFRYAVVVIFIIAAIITPPDPLTQVMLGVPMVLLYAIGILVAWMFSTKVREPGAVSTGS